MVASRNHTVFTLAAALLLIALLGGQGLTDALLPQTGAPGRSLGRAGFAYLTGLRTFIAEVVWNRLEPQYHGYYEDVALKNQTQMLPTIKLVTTLDPQFEDSYYVGAWVLVRRGDIDEGLRLARLGVENNPTSGELLTSYAQLLQFYGDDINEAVAQADLTLARGTWPNLIEQHDDYAILRVIYHSAGDLDKAAFLEDEIARLDAEIGDALPAGAHDHDGDGVPDH